MCMERNKIRTRVSSYLDDDTVVKNSMSRVWRGLKPSLQRYDRAERRAGARRRAERY